MNEIRILVQFTAENLAVADNHVAQLETTCSRMSHTPGCLQFEVFRSATQRRRYALIEHWASQTAHEAFQLARGARPEPPAGVTLVREYYDYQTWSLDRVISRITCRRNRVHECVAVGNGVGVVGYR